jgi:hypothetical protein
MVPDHRDTKDNENCRYLGTKEIAKEGIWQSEDSHHRGVRPMSSGIYCLSMAHRTERHFAKSVNTWTGLWLPECSRAKSRNEARPAKVVGEAQSSTFRGRESS